MRIRDHRVRARMDQHNLVELVQQLRQGNAEAREHLVGSVYERLLKLSRKMLRSGSSAVRRWEQTEDLVHAAWFRIQRALEDESVTIRDDAHFFRLAARHLRFEFIDLYRKHNGVYGVAANHQTVPRTDDGGKPTNDGERFQASPTENPTHLSAWYEFHRIVEQLPEPEKAVVDLLWYQGLLQREAAELLGVDVKTIKRRWRSAKLSLSEKLDGSLAAL